MLMRKVWPLAVTVAEGKLELNTTLMGILTIDTINIENNMKVKRERTRFTVWAGVSITADTLSQGRAVSMSAATRRTSGIKAIVGSLKVLALQRSLANGSVETFVDINAIVVRARVDTRESRAAQLEII